MNFYTLLASSGILHENGMNNYILLFMLPLSFLGLIAYFFKVRPRMKEQKAAQKIWERENKEVFIWPFRIINALGIVVIGLGVLEIFFGYFIKLVISYVIKEAEFGNEFVLLQYMSAYLFFVFGILIFRLASQYKKHKFFYTNLTGAEKRSWHEKKYKSASSVVYFIGGITIFWAIALYILNEKFPKNILEIDNYYIFSSIFEGLIFLILGYLTRRKINIALIIAILIYGYDTFIYTQLLLGIENQFFPLWSGIVFRVLLLFPPMFKGIYSIYQIKKIPMEITGAGEIGI